MWFKNLLVYRVGETRLKKDDLAEKLKDNALQPCGSFEMLSRGWMAPREEDEYVYNLERQWLILQGVNQKLLPGTVISQVARERADKLAQKQEHPVGRKQLREIRERVIEELMPKALTRRSTLRGWLDTVNGWFVLDTAAAKKADEFVEALVSADADLGLKRLDTAQSPALAMTNWLSTGHAPANFTIDQDLELKASGEQQATVRYVNHPLDGREIRDHIASGKTATRLGLTWKNKVSFLLTEQLQIKRVNFVDVLQEDSEAGAEDADEQFAIEFSLMTGELSAMLTDLSEALGGIKT